MHSAAAQRNSRNCRRLTAQQLTSSSMIVLAPSPHSSIKRCVVKVTDSHEDKEASPGISVIWQYLRSTAPGNLPCVPRDNSRAQFSVLYRKGKPNQHTNTNVGPLAENSSSQSPIDRLEKNNSQQKSYHVPLLSAAFRLS